MKRWLTRALLDGIVPIAVLMGLSIAIMGTGWTQMHSVIIGGGNATTPSDVNGTLWFYWWVSEAMSRGVDLFTPDVICAPTGQSLGSNFPQHIDAMMAAPFIANLPFPASFNLWVSLIPALGGFAAFMGARWLGLGRSVALMIAVLFGFNSLSLHELANGKPPSAMVFTLPLFACAWIKALSSKGRSSLVWITVTGFAAALAIQHYVLYALICALFAGFTLLFFSIRPVVGVKRKRAVVAGIMVVFIGLSFSAPYLKRLLLERRPMTSATAPRLTDPAVLREQAESINVGYIFGVDEDEDLPRRAAFPVVLTFAALLLIPVGGTRHRRWLMAAAGFYLLSLGPMAASSVRPEVEWMTIAGRGVPLPTWWLNTVFPFSLQFFHPCRVFPMVLLCAAMSVGTGLSHWTRDWGRRWATPAIAVAIAAIGLAQVQLQGGMTILTAAWSPHPFFERIANEANPGAILEFPVGLGHATAPEQIVHGWKRSESHHDAIAGLKANQRPEDCLQLSIFDSLWEMSRGDLEQLPSPAELSEATESGFRYLVVWRAGFDVLRQAGIDIDRERSIRGLRRVLGTPIVSDDQLVVWALGDPS